MGDIFIDMSYICAYESFMAETDMLTMDPASEAFGVSIKKFFSNIRAAIMAVIAKIRQRIRAIIDRVKSGARNVTDEASSKVSDAIVTGIKKIEKHVYPENYGEKRAPSKPKNYDAYLRNAFAVMTDLEKIIKSDEFKITVGSWMGSSWNIDEAEEYLKSIQSELEDLKERADATVAMCTPEIRAYLYNFDLRARTKFAQSYKSIDDTVRGIERNADAEIAKCEKLAEEWFASARDDMARGRSSDYSRKNAEEYKNEAMEARNRCQRALKALQYVVHAVNACANTLVTKA